MGGMLADIPSADARLDISNLLQYQLKGENQVWIGLTKSRWKWSTGK